MEGGGGGGEKRKLTHPHSKPNTSVSRREIILTACRWMDSRSVVCHSDQTDR